MHKTSSCLMSLIFTVMIIFVALPLYGQSVIPKDTKYKAPINQDTKGGNDHAKDANANQDAATRTLPKKDEIRPTTNLVQGKQKDDYSRNNSMGRYWEWVQMFFKWLWTIETLTFFLVIATLILAIAALKQGKYFRRELALTQRPRLRVSNVVTKNFPVFFGEDEHIKGQLYITNIGGMPAKITNIGCWIKVLEGGLPMERPHEGENPNYPNMSTKLMPGQSFTLPFDSDIMRKAAYDKIRGGLSGYILYVMGYVEYVDDIGTPRKTSFCRQYRLPGDRVAEDRRTIRFFAVTDPDYEYEA